MKPKEFVQTVWNYYHERGRFDLPWRNTVNSYEIYVSEIMLQQTQVKRVEEKYSEFLAHFSDISMLANADTHELLTVWQGMGYNRRALYARDAARVIVRDHNGKIPRSVEALEQLPGIGPYTARAILAFAWNEPVVFIETNIRSAFIHSFFPGTFHVHDKEILPLVEKTLDHKNPREWYYALMDYGVHLKKTHGNPNRRSKQYVKQAPFKGSDREIRGTILKVLLERPLTEATLKKLVKFDERRVNTVLEQLMTEDFIELQDKKYTIKT